jgi:hypothetical protein
LSAGSREAFSSRGLDFGRSSALCTLVFPSPRFL